MTRSTVNAPNRAPLEQLAVGIQPTSSYSGNVSSCGAYCKTGATVRRCVLALLMILVAGCDNGAGPAIDASGGSAEIGDYRARFNVTRGAHLPEAIAREHSVEHSMDVYLLNVSVYPAGAGVTAKPVAADIEATVANANAQLEAIDMQPAVANGDTTYYGTVEIANVTRLDFNLRIQPDGSDETFEIAFHRDFNIDP